jgi:hypothetical protein
MIDREEKNVALTDVELEVVLTALDSVQFIGPLGDSAIRAEREIKRAREHPATHFE